MPTRCDPQKVEEVYLHARSWRKAASELNALYGVHLSHTTWRDYATGKHDIADPETRARLLLPPRPCPTCGYKPMKRRQAKTKQIREYGYPTEKAKTFLELIDLHHAPR